jgi:hypothetical protein
VEDAKAMKVKKKVSRDPMTLFIRVRDQPHEMEFSPQDGRGFSYDSFYVHRSALEPGWFIYGRRVNVSPTVIRICARPRVAARVRLPRRRATRAGWKTKRDALKALATLSAYLSK